MEMFFDATAVEPNQGGKAHPVGKFPAQITETKIVANKENDGGMFRVTFTTQAGTIYTNYNLWNKSEQAVNISKGQLSALCHATGIFKLDFSTGVEGAALHGARCMIEVQPQMLDGQPHPKGFTQLSRIYDIQGNEPGRSAANAGAPKGSWGAQPAPAVQVQPREATAPQAWQPGPTAAPAPAQAPAPQGWTQNSAPASDAAIPPWAK